MPFPQHNLRFLQGIYFWDHQQYTQQQPQQQGIFPLQIVQRTKQGKSRCSTPFSFLLFFPNHYRETAIVTLVRTHTVILGTDIPFSHVWRTSDLSQVLRIPDGLVDCGKGYALPFQQNPQPSLPVTSTPARPSDCPSARGSDLTSNGYSGVCSRAGEGLVILSLALVLLALEMEV